jgi:hypothetical protein
MNTTSRLEQIRKATAEAVAADRERRAALAAESSPPPRPGDVYLLPGPSAIDLRWVVLAAHPEMELLFAVPADGHPLVGLTDVEVDAAQRAGPLVLRCGHGLWVHGEEFRPELRVGALEEQYVRRGLDKLAQMTGGGLRGPASQWESEANPDYEEWLAEVGGAVDAVAEALRLRKETFYAADFEPLRQFPAALGSPTDAEPQLALAAASPGALPDLYESLRGNTGGLPARRLNYPHPGDLFLLLEEEGVAVLHVSEGGVAPPVVHTLDPAGASLPAEWFPTPRGTATRAFFPWQGGEVRLYFGRGEGAREVTVKQPAGDQA